MAHSFIQILTATDQSKVQNQFVVGSVGGDAYGYTGSVRANSIQAAIDNAAGGDTINLRTGAGADPASRVPGHDLPVRCRSARSTPSGPWWSRASWT